MATSDPADIRRRLSGMLGQFARLQDVRTQLAEMQTEGEAAEGLVGVTVGPTGALSHVRIDPRAMRLDSESLADSIMEAAREATARASERAMELFAGLDTGIDVGALMTSGRTAAPNEVEDPQATIERLRGLLS